MAQGSGLTRGNRNANRKIGALRAVVRRDRAVAGIDLGEDKQVAVVTDHDGQVLARKTVTAKAWQLGPLLEWAAGAAARAGLDGLTVACEPTGHRWKAVMGLADAAGHGFVCVQPLAVARSREISDYTRDKTDQRDAYLIARLVIRLDCYLPERAGEAWALLRQLGARRSRLAAEETACRQQAADLLGCCWPAALETAVHPLDSTTWLAAMSVVAGRCAGDLARIRKMGYARFLAAVRGQLPGWGACKIRHVIAEAVWDALTSAAGVMSQRRGGLERLKFLLQDWQQLTRRLAATEARLTETLDELGLAALAASIDGVSALSAALILAETGDMARFTSGRAVVKHAGLSPSEHTSATMAGTTRISRRGRPGLRTAAWRAVWGALRHNRVLAAKYTHLTSRDTGNRLNDAQARVACAAAVLRWLWAVITTGTPWDARIAAGVTAGRAMTPAAA